MVSVTFTGCGQKESGDVIGPKPEVVQVSSGDELMYIPVSSAAASSFDQTPDWAPEPNPMATSDGDMLTRWSSSYMPGEQWISLDMGQERVISDVIIRWERAYATDYDIEVSGDNKSWTNVYSQQGSSGGSVESSFSPIKCRYVKIVSKKRVNDSWGISIWEVEIYGPASHNPGVTVTKDRYLSKEDQEEMGKEVLGKINENAAPIIPIKQKPFQKGVVYTSWMADELAMPSSDLTLLYLKDSGVDTVSIMVPAYQDTLYSAEVYTNDKPDGDTPTDAALKHAVDICHKLGMRVMIKPHVDPRTDEARINIMPSEEWFDSYEKFVLRYAKFSQENNAELFAVGTELEATSFEGWTHRWEPLIDKVREVYKGDLTYAANWTEYEGVPFWHKMDFIGIDAYFPLTNDDDPNPVDLRNSWEAIADKIEVWLEDKGLTDKGVILTEIGYPSARGASRQPWVAISDVEDQDEQAECLDAVFEVLSKRPWFQGYYIWQYFPQDRWSPLGFTVKGKKAEEIIKKWMAI